MPSCLAHATPSLETRHVINAVRFNNMWERGCDANRRGFSASGRQRATDDRATVGNGALAFCANTVLLRRPLRRYGGFRIARQLALPPPPRGAAPWRATVACAHWLVSAGGRASAPTSLLLRDRAPTLRAAIECRLVGRAAVGVGSARAACGLGLRAVPEIVSGVEIAAGVIGHTRGGSPGTGRRASNAARSIAATWPDVRVDTIVEDRTAYGVSLRALAVRSPLRCVASRDSLRS